MGLFHISTPLTIREKEILTLIAAGLTNAEIGVRVSTDPLFWPMMSVPPVLLILGVWVIWRMVNMKI